MIKSIKMFAILIASGAIISGCSIALQVNTTSNTIGSKVGTAKSNVVFGLVFNGDASIKTAAKNGGITKISTFDMKSTNALGLFITFETIITGE
jgi:TRL-like protein family